MANNTNVTIPQYAAKMGVAVPGQLFGTNEHVVLVKKAGEDIAFGAPLFAQSADAHEVKATDSTKALTFVGIAGFTQLYDGCYKDDMPVNCVKQGFIYVKVASSAIAEGEKVYVKYADGKFYSATDYAAGTAGDFVDIHAVAVEAGAAANAIVPIRIEG